MQVRCGQCIACRLYRAREWAIRMVHELQVTPGREAMFLTLTYRDQEVPSDGSLDRGAFPRFAKRLRKAVGRSGLRYFHCGEYGEANLRPHYHCALFGYRDPELYRWSRAPSGFDLYRSPVVERCWKFGHVAVGELDFASAQYVAGYVTKKVTVSKMTGPEDFARWESRYERVDGQTGEVVRVEPEFSTCSNRPGLGARWLERFHKEVYPADSVVIEGHELPVPRYYDKLMERWNPELMARVKRKRVLERERENDGEERLIAMESVALARSQFYGGRDS